MISPATLVDAADATALLGRQLAEHEITLTGATLEAAVAAILEDETKGKILLARRDGVAIGVACMARTFTLELGGYAWWVDELYVVQELRSQGIGKALLDAAVDFARTKGAVAVELEVEVSHGRVMGLYLRSGFRKLSRTRFQLALPR